MNYRERILATIRGEEVDHIPWAPRWELWYDAARRDGRLPEKYRDWHIYDIARDLGMGIKTHYRTAWREVLHNVEVREHQKGYETLIEYVTPVGTVSTVWKSSSELEAQGVRALRIRYPVKKPEDYGPVLYMLEHTEIVPEHGKNGGPKSYMSAHAKTLLSDLLQHLGFAAEIKEQQLEDGLLLDIECDEASQLTGRQGQVLSQLQYILNRLLFQMDRESPKVTLDVAGYRTKARELLVKKDFCSLQSQF